MNDHFGRGRPASLVVSPTFYRTLVRNLKVNSFSINLSMEVRPLQTLLSEKFAKTWVMVPLIENPRSAAVQAIFLSDSMNQLH